MWLRAQHPAGWGCRTALARLAPGSFGRGPNVGWEEEKLPKVFPKSPGRWESKPGALLREAWMVREERRRTSGEKCL